jgi:hypothetical protein
MERKANPIRIVRLVRSFIETSGGLFSNIFSITDSNRKEKRFFTKKDQRKIIRIREAATKEFLARNSLMATPRA